MTLTNIKKTAFSLVALLAIPLFASSALAQNKIAYVDIEKALSKSKAGGQAQEVYEGEVKEHKAKIEEKQSELKELKEKYKAQKESLSASSRGDKEERIISLEKDLKRSLRDSQETLQRKNSQMVGELVRKIRRVVSKIGKDRGYTVILEKNAQPVLYADDGIDITSQVVSQFDKQEG